MILRAARLATERRPHHPLAAALPSGGLGEDEMNEKMTYAAQLRHPNWQRRRLEMLSAANWQCQRCRDDSTTLHVHHRRYVKGRMAWEYEDGELLVLCETCHEEEHFGHDALIDAASMAEPGAVQLDQLAALIAGFLSEGNPFGIEPNDKVKAVIRHYPEMFAAGQRANDVFVSLVASLASQKDG